MKTQYQYQYQYYFKNNRFDEPYESEIAFINTNNGTIKCIDIAYIEYTKNNKTAYGYFKSDDFTKQQYYISKNSSKNQTEQHKRISKIQISTWYFSYIKVIKDKQNPQLEGEILLFKFGRSLAGVIGEYLISNNHQEIKNTLKLEINYKHGVPNFTESFMIDEELYLRDDTLCIDDEIKFKHFNTLNMDRKEKLKKLKKQF